MLNVLFTQFILKSYSGSPLYIASKNGYDEIVRLLLLNKNIKVNALTNGVLNFVSGCFFPL